jgi:hypothetical protein
LFRGSDDDGTKNEAIKITQYLGWYVPEIFGRMPLNSQEKNVIPSRRLLFDSSFTLKYPIWSVFSVIYGRVSS